ncbi:alpha-amylase family glycosyl hydrolase [Silvibacterium dinghuense]|uniref:Alpha-amylase n=1 Tax=Silvibacterium dinghuense TaxID=1560006 RepID=A0A4Q1SDB7_9BACT|nr:alpha-amylase family glycosyl hydrolase [Silvibacterium dinghuense]RXS95055.1 alpha-amylase [Silvibacterium dinghuense]GGH10213.1 alpha-amylase [Silvibacterium dinghuense]
MEFHISREARQKYDVDETLFSYTGNVVFANLAASRELAAKVNKVRGADLAPERAIHAAALFAMGLIDELSHAIIARFRTMQDPGVLTEALRWFGERQNQPEVEKLLRTFTSQFPNTPIYRGEITVEQWLDGVTEDLPNREAAFEELVLLWLANVNPAFRPFREFFDDRKLSEQTVYKEVTPELDTYFATRPRITLEGGTLLEALKAPMLASPDSLSGQLSYIGEHWGEHLGPELDKALRQTLLAMDVLKEEEIAIWLQFHPPSASKWHEYRADQGWGAEGFEGDEFQGFMHAHGVMSGSGMPEYEAFSPDTDWMPNVVLIAKSTYVWLEQLSKKYGRHIARLDQIPDEELELLARRGLNGLWLIGLWERSDASQTIKRMRGQIDAVASAYSLKDYAIAQDIGGYLSYTNLRDRAARYGIRLASDMVPNHMGIDSYWVMDHPDWFLTRPDSPYPSYTFEGPDLSNDPRVEIKIEDHYYDQTDAAVVFRRRDRWTGHTEYIYHGNDGTQFAWNDTAQLDYSKAHVREQVIQTILHVARQFPIIRFDAAMTLAKKHVQRLWFPLPGAGGAIPSRAEFAMTQEQFDALMPHEFWREVVDRVAAEVPGTLLLAEAFWLLEGYFVRTLGMHRVYNSAFMNMLRDEENAKYRSYLQKTIEFDADILKRYVNFMSNPDERTAIDQFGTGDKYFGVCTMMATLPGLPMFGHGQIEAFTEKYGMEFKKARYDEWPNEDLVARHMREIAPLLKNRALFAESQNFAFYDFWTESGTVDENVFAYSNRRGDQRALVLFHNRYGETQGTVHNATPMMDKGAGGLVQRRLHEALALPSGNGAILACEDTASGLKYLFRAGAIEHHGLRFELRAYQYAVLQGWRVMVPTAEYPWDQLCDVLGGAGVRDLDEALVRLRLRPVHEALKEALSPVLVEGFIETVEATAAPARINKAETQATPAAGSVFVLGLADRAEDFYRRVSERVDLPLPGKALQENLDGLQKLPGLLEKLNGEAAEGARRILPMAQSAERASALWAPILAWQMLTSLASQPEERGELFDRLRLREALAEAFWRLGLVGEGAWRAAARVRILLSEEFAGSGLESETETRNSHFWEDPEVRWLLAVNESDGIAYFNQECLEELFWWVQLPGLLSGEETAADITERFTLWMQRAEESGFQLEAFLKPEQEEAKDAEAEESEVSETVKMVEIAEDKPVIEEEPASSKAGVE